MQYPILYNIKDSSDNKTNYFIDDGCNVFLYDGENYNPIHIHNRKKDGRPIVCLNLDGNTKNYLAYRLLMKSRTNMSSKDFSKYVVDHKDSNPRKNTSDNLELVSQAENMRRAAINNRMPKGENHFNSKYSDSIINGICNDICNKLSRQDIMAKYSVNGQLIDDIRSGRSHKSISSKYIDNGFEYKTYDRSEGVEKAKKVCELLQSGYSISQVSSITGFGRNFVEPIFNKRTFKDVSINYNF